MCTSLTLTTMNQLNTLARTMDFAFLLEPELVFIPRKYPLVSQVDSTVRPVNYAMMGIGRNLETYIFNEDFEAKEPKVWDILLKQGYNQLN